MQSAVYGTGCTPILRFSIENRSKRNETFEVIDFKFHDLRHTAATRLADAGADPFVIAEILGHSDLRMTKRYTHATDERKRQALERLGQFSNRKPEKRRSFQTNCHKIVTMKDRRVG